MKLSIQIKTNVVFDHLEQSDKRIIIEQGGTRSGKTYNILQWILFRYCMENNKKIITITRKNGPALRGSAMRDFFEILNTKGLYSEDNHFKSINEYFFMGNIIEFVSLDEPQKIRGRKRDVLFINEGNELNWEDFFQLNIRTNERIILDFNPSDEFHWIYDKVIPREDSDFFQTTYLDNPFLEESLVKEIERLKGTDENYWRIYGLGERGQSRSLVFSFGLVDSIPETAKRIGMGLDFGYSNDPTALVETYIEGENMYINELLYRTEMTNQDIGRTFELLNLDRRDEIWADSSEPKSIAEIHKMGWNIKPTFKGAINLSIDMMRRYKILLTKTSANLIKEFKNYKYIEDKNGNITNRPFDAFNHSIDATRYSIVNRLSRPNYGTYAIR
ncbi:MAG: putative terminase large subunit [Prokaryotic dsDNA virus sp.]|nr:MAG: putative terminase large subunit [Prokaryotic dsDNA virus sp.]